MELSEPATAIALILGTKTNLETKKAAVSGAGKEIDLFWYPKAPSKDASGASLGKGIKNNTVAFSRLEEWWASKGWQDLLNSNKIVMSATDSASSNKGLNSKTIYDEIKKATLAYNKTKTPGDKKKLDAARKKKKVALEQVAVGISAGISINSWLKHEHKLTRQGGNATIQKVYLTGGTWDSDIAQFRIGHAGMDDFNSSDLVIWKGAKFFYGVSLKKKAPNSKADPTMINRSIDGAIRQVNSSHEDAVDEWVDGKKVKLEKPTTLKSAANLMELIDKARFDFFGGIANSKTFRNLVEEHEEVIVPPLSKVGSLKNLMAYKWNKQTIDLHTDTYLGIGSANAKEAIKKRLKQGHQKSKHYYTGKKDFFVGRTTRWSGNKPLIDLKGKDKGSDLPIRDYVTSQVAKGDHDFFRLMKGALDGSAGKKIAGELAEELTDHVLKISLSNMIAENKQFKKYYFGFGLCTGKAQITALSGKGREGIGLLKIETGITYELRSIICALSKWFGEGSDPHKDYHIRILPNSETTATIEMVMDKMVIDKGKKIGSVPILKLQLRYKGTGFAAAMQFQGSMTDELKHLVVRGCQKGEHHH